MAETELSPPAFQFTNAASLSMKFTLFTLVQKEGTLNFLFLLVSGFVSAKEIHGLLSITPLGTILTLFCISLITIVSTMGGGRLSSVSVSIDTGGGILSCALELRPVISITEVINKVLILRKKLIWLKS